VKEVLSHSSTAEIQMAAASDARYVWDELHLRPGNDGEFNWFEIGMKIGDAERAVHKRHLLNEESPDYDKTFEDTFKAIAREIQDKE
jgi:hypothetical protein